jgi:hypothetical protein
MRNDNDGQADMTDTLAHDLCERRKSGADNGHRRNTEIFECGRVTRGPGRGRPSVTDTIDDGVALRRHLLRIRGRHAKVTFLPEPDLRDTMFALQHIRHATQHDVGEFLAVVQDTDARAARVSSIGYRPRR